MTAQEQPPPSGFNPTLPNVARMYDYALGGKDNFAVDRDALEQVFAIAPEGRDVAPVNRRFLGRAVRFAAGQGIGQFLDLGTGFPNLGNVHEVARQIRPGAHVVYVDYDRCKSGCAHAA